MKKLIIALFLVLFGATPALAAEPLAWLQGGYGPSTPTHQVVTCPPFSPENGRPTCPEGTNEIYRVTAWYSNDVWEVFEGDAKWYFEPLEVKPGAYRLQFDYQPYTWGAEATAWYQLKDGTDRYELLSHLPQENPAGGMGYMRWQKADLTFTPASDVAKFTVFLSSTGKKHSVALGPSHHTLNIGNISLEAPAVVTANADLLMQITDLEAEIARLQALLVELKSRV